MLLSETKFFSALRGFVLQCNASDLHVYRHHHTCRNAAQFWVTELGMRFCKYHLGDVLFLLGLDEYTLHRLEW